VSALPQHVSAVTVDGAVDGTRRRRAALTRRRLAELTHHVVVDPRVMEAARTVLREGQRLVIVSAEEVRIVNA
jgi:hypothetical protein